jgi:hypothetical protein
VHLDIYLPYASPLGGRLRLKVEVLAEYPDTLSFGKWTLLRLEAHIATKMAALLDRHFSEKGQKDAREILTLLKLEDIDPTVAAKILQRASTVSIEDLPAMIGEAFDLIRTIIPLSKIDQRLIAATKKSRIGELQLRGSRSQVQRPTALKPFRGRSSQCAITLRRMWAKPWAKPPRIGPILLSCGQTQFIIREFAGK